MMTNLICALLKAQGLPCPGAIIDANVGSVCDIEVPPHQLHVGSLQQAILSAQAHGFGGITAKIAEGSDHTFANTITVPPNFVLTLVVGESSDSSCVNVGSTTSSPSTPVVLEAPVDLPLFDVEGHVIVLSGVELHGNGHVVGDGGVVLVRDNALLALGGRITGGHATRGGGVAVLGTAQRPSFLELMRGAAIEGNQADVGGGLFLEYTTTTTTTLPSTGTVRIVDNSAVSGAGAGVYAEYGTLTATDWSVAGNVATSEGGGLYLGSVDAALTNNTVSANSADEGGGIYAAYGTQLTVGVDVDSCDVGTLADGVVCSQILGNTASPGGGLAVAAGARAELYSTWISDNAPPPHELTSGDGLWLEGGASALLASVLITDNQGRGVYAGGTVAIHDSTVSGNQVGLEVSAGNVATFEHGVLVGAVSQSASGTVEGCNNVLEHADDVRCLAGDNLVPAALDFVTVRGLPWHLPSVLDLPDLTTVEAPPYSAWSVDVEAVDRASAELPGAFTAP